MARMKQLATAADDVVEAFLDGKFLEAMEGYAQAAGTSNPAVRAAEELREGRAAVVPGEWIGREWAGLIIRLRRGAPVTVVGRDD